MDLFQIKGTKSIPNEKIELSKISQSFQNAMQLSHDIFGIDAFRKTINVNAKKINKPLFEIISVYFSKLNQSEREQFLSRKEDIKSDFIDLQKDPIFWNAITTGTAGKESVRKRHELFKEFLSKYLI